MENMINQILEMDKKARAMESEAIKNREALQAQMQARRQQLYGKYAESMKEIIEMTDASQQEELAAGKEKLDNDTNAILWQMEQRFQAEKENWVAHITEEVLGSAQQ